MKLLVGLASATGSAVGLHVTHWQDSMTVQPGHYIELINSNSQSVLSAAIDSKTSLKQDLAVDLVSCYDSHTANLKTNPRRFKNSPIFTFSIDFF